ncbi:hypothetical protein HHK36_020356 [Tetracentron sinense]|uniref:Protein DA1-like domain-containing protein n=1 Tax=Tetracentron sinense TaxID=13715 RepID=A0A834YV03_TETSI|nr:hypothetical protein HHK36_020356 [Tetracentron sinense]
MEWLQQLFDGSTHETSEWKYPGKDEWSQDENEDIDRAITQSFLEERKGKRVIEEDEYLARALQESLNINEYPHQHDYENIFQPYTFPSFTGYNSLQRVLNIGCILSGTKNTAATMTMMALLGALAANVWRSVKKDMLIYLLNIHTHYTSIEDGRKFCQECLEIAIMSTEECLPLYVDIQDFFEGLNMKVEQQVPLHLVDRHGLNEVVKGEKSAPELRGLCMSETRDVNSVVRSSRIMEAFRVKIMKKKPYKLKRKWEVTAIIILSGLPRLLTGSILAHELMHAWMRLKGYSTVSRDVKEGMCAVLAHMWLESEIMLWSASTSSSSSSTRRSKFEKNFGEFCKRKIEKDQSKVCADRFRAANRAVSTYGLQATLAHIGKTGSFPP